MSQPTAGDTTTPPASDTSPTGAPLLLVESDLFFLVKVRDTLGAAGYRVRVARRIDEGVRLLGEASPTLVLVNAAGRGIDWRVIVAQARERGLPVIVYAPHVDTETQAAARAAGATRVIANSRLGADLPALVARTLRSTMGQIEAGSATAGDSDHSDTAATTDKHEAAAKTATPGSPPSAGTGGGAGFILSEEGAKNEIAAKTATPSPPLPPRGGGAGGGGGGHERREAVDS